MRTRLRTFSELSNYHTLESRFRYLSLGGQVGLKTFGWERWINQDFYQSREWKHIRNLVIVRDNGCDLGIDGFEIHGQLHVHHMNPMVPEDIIHRDEHILDPEFLITCSHRTHNAIHYGDERLLPRPFVERRAGDTIPWRRQHV